MCSGRPQIMPRFARVDDMGHFAAIDLGFVPNGRPSIYRICGRRIPRQGPFSGCPVRTETTTSWIARVTAAA